MRKSNTGRPQSPKSKGRRKEPDNDAIQAFARAVADRIEHVPPGRLKPFRRRTRTHSEEQIVQIMGSLGAFGFMTPVIIDEGDHILAGHARVEAARRLSYASVPVVIASHLSDDEKRAYVVADNRLAEKAGWDRGVLAIELSELAQIDLGFDLDILGFSIGEIDVLVQEAACDQSSDDILPPATDMQANTRLGDLWQLGRHRLLCGNSLHAASFASLLEGAKARMVLTDSPFNVPIHGFVGGLGAVKHREFAMASGEMSEAQFTDFLTQALAYMAASTMDGGLIYAFMDWRHEFELLTAARAVGLKDHNLCVWNKLSGGMGSHYRSQHELCRIFKVGNAPHLNTVELGRHGRSRTNVWDHPGMSSFGRGRDEALASHPTVKPVALLADAIKDCTRRGDLVLDPFLGSGSTLIAAERTGRRAAGIELDPLYCDTIVRRFEALTGERAIHLPSGLTFDALRVQRGPSDGDELKDDELEGDAACAALSSQPRDDRQAASLRSPADKATPQAVSVRARERRRA